RDGCLAPPPVGDRTGWHFERRGEDPRERFERPNLVEAQALALKEDDPDRHPQDEHGQRLDAQKSPNAAAVCAHSAGVTQCGRAWSPASESNLDHNPTASSRFESAQVK